MHSLFYLWFFELVNKASTKNKSLGASFDYKKIFNDNIKNSFTRRKLA